MPCVCHGESDCQMVESTVLGSLLPCQTSLLADMYICSCVPCHEPLSHYDLCCVDEAKLGWMWQNMSIVACVCTCSVSCSCNPVLVVVEMWGRQWYQQCYSTSPWDMFLMLPRIHASCSVCLYLCCGVCCGDVSWIHETEGVHTGDQPSNLLKWFWSWLGSFKLVSQVWYMESAYM